MLKYKSVYPFQVLDKIKCGEYIYMTDRKEWKIYSVNTMSVAFMLAAINDTTGRFDFWTKEDTDITGGEEA